MKTENTILNADKRIFLIKFQWQPTNGTFLCSDMYDFMKVLKEQDKNGIESIKVFDPSKDKFVRVSKKDILMFASWETEVSEYLKTHYYFK